MYKNVSISYAFWLQYMHVHVHVLYIPIRVETGSGQSAYPGQIGHFSLGHSRVSGLSSKNQIDSVCNTLSHK